MKISKLNLLIALALFAAINAAFPPEAQRLDSLPSDAAYLSFFDKILHWNNELAADVAKDAAVAAKKPLPGCPPPPRKPSYENTDGMGVASGGHVGVSQADVRRMEGGDGESLPDGPPGSPADEKVCNELNVDTNRQLEQYLKGTVGNGGIQSKIREYSNGDAARPKADEKPEISDGLFKDLVSSFNKGLGVNNEPAPKSASSEHLDLGQRPNVKDLIDKLNTDEAVVAGINNQPKPARSKPIDLETGPSVKDQIDKLDGDTGARGGMGRGAGASDPKPHGYGKWTKSQRQVQRK